MNYGINPLMIIGVKEIQKVEPKTEWEIKKDRFGAYMVFYKNIPAEEIIFAVGEMTLVKQVKDLFRLQKEYYDDGYADTYNIAMKILRDESFSEKFYRKYKELQNKL